MRQTTALEILKTGGNVFLTGEPGAGKTYVINQYIAWLQAAKVPAAVTTSTGIAATHIGGTTIHSWSGIGVKDELSHYDLDAIAGKEKVSKRIKKAKVLVIDEVSMLDGKVVDMVDHVCKMVRQSTDAFGGLQVVFVGDFYQLPPVTRQGNMMRYAFESFAWQEAKLLTCYITEQYRQEDEMFLGLLSSIRKNEIEEDHYTLLNEQKDIGYEGIEPTKLYTHNADVDAVNAGKLKELPGTTHKFFMTSAGPKLLVEGLVRNCLSPQTLELKEGAMVMCTKNNFEAGFVNGTLGRVINFSGEKGFPVIETSDGRELIIEPMSWEVMEDGKVRASLEQVPLRLAWAITVHKSQGMSLDAAEIDLSKAFVYGQGYVALSRVRTLLGLKVLGMHPNALQVDPKVIHQDAKFRTESEMAEDTFSEMDENELTKLHTQFVTAVGGTMPTGKVTVVDVHERLKQESTLEQTKRLLLEGKSVEEIAKERGLTTGTVWGHLEDLQGQGEIDLTHVALLTEQISDWDTIYVELQSIIDSVGTEKLKPIYEAAGEKYDYDIIRAARLYFLTK
ncbi:MAG: AAA family ATPase [Candidatus Paceibacterota bacterium]